MEVDFSESLSAFIYFTYSKTKIKRMEKANPKTEYNWEKNEPNRLANQQHNDTGKEKKGILEHSTSTAHQSEIYSE